jgi:hypothetical protein
MPTIVRRPVAQQERDRLEARRLRAAELFAVGVRQAEVGVDRVRRTPHLAYSFLRHAGLSVSFP